MEVYRYLRNKKKGEKLPPCDPPPPHALMPLTNHVLLLYTENQWRSVGSVMGGGAAFSLRDQCLLNNFFLSRHPFKN